MYNQNCRYRVQTETQEIVIKAGERQASQTVRLNKGDEIRFAALTKEELPFFLNIGLYESGHEINRPMDISFWRDRDRAPSAFDGFMKINSLGNSEVEAKAIISTTYTQDIRIQVVFLIKQEIPVCS